MPEGDGVTWAVCMASLARSVALGPVRTKVAVSERGTAFCVACCASWGVAPTVVGVLLVCAQVPAAARARAAVTERVWRVVLNMVASLQSAVVPPMFASAHGAAVHECLLSL